jgi:alpha-N-arabinofuranosidase
MKVWFAPLVLLLVSVSALAAPTVTVDASKVVAQVSPRLYGLMTEEINYSYDGGLYAELIRNRVMLDNATAPDHWSAFGENAAGVKVSLDATVPLNDKLPMALKVVVGTASAGHGSGVANDGYWGIPIQANTSYRVSFYARIAAGGPDALTVSLSSPDRSVVYASGMVSGVGNTWAKHELVLTTGAVTPTANARFVISLEAPGTAYFTLVSLFPPTWNNQPNGFRRDLMQMMIDMKPKFLRFPGGNYLEGGSLAQRFQWKNTIGPLEQRPGHQSPWGYRSSDGMGLLEFLLWCEAMGAEPVLGLYAGYSLDGSHVATGSALDPYVQDALDEIEYVSGDISTKWGAQRAADGHAAPFTLRYVEIGNEDFFDKSLSYDARFTQFFDAIRAQYPSLRIISSVGNEQSASLRVKSRQPDMLDEHYYRATDEFIATAKQFDTYSRSGPEIFVGEWAAHETASIRPWDAAAKTQPVTPTFKAAIGDAVWMIAMERNSDLIKMQCYAPLLVNVNTGAWQWRPDLIGYTALSSYGSPSYHALAMFGSNLGEELLGTTSSDSTIFACATRATASGRIFLKLVNTSASAQSLQLAISGASGLVESAKLTTLSASLDALNTIDAPTTVLPVQSTLHGVSSSFTYSIPGNGIVVMAIDTVLPPAFAEQPASKTIAPGGSVTLSAKVTGAVSYQWLKDGVALSGATSASLTLSALSSANTGAYTLVATNAVGSTTSSKAQLLVDTPNPGRLMNLSVRSFAGSGAQTLTAGFALSGTGTRPLLIRGIGPTLSLFGLSSVLADPKLEVMSGQVSLATNDNWGGVSSLAQAFAQVGAFDLASASLDASLLWSPTPGAYTAQVTGVAGGTGIALVEVYDASADASLPRLVNLSARTQVGLGDSMLIAGFSISGNVPKHLLIRGVGPELSTFGVTGVLSDPKLQIFDASKTLVAENDNWSDAPNDPAALATAANSVGAFALAASSKDSVLLLTLVHGNYTAQVTGVAATTGVALVEVYELSD